LVRKRAGVIGQAGGSGAGRLAALVVACAAMLFASAALAAGTTKPRLPSKDPFYTYKGPLTHIKPGTVLKQRKVTIVDASTGKPVPTLSAQQVLYRTTSELGKPTITVATVIRSVVPNPNQKKIVSYQTAYDALGSQCDPSYTLRGGNRSYSTAAEEEKIIELYAHNGYTVVVPDYESVHLDWGAGQESGYGTLDGIRAAEHLLKLPAKSTPVGMVGYSGGSIATEFASELAPKYAPHLHIVGTAEGGIPAYFAHNLAYINGSQSWSGVIPAVLIGTSRAFKIDSAKYESAYGRKIARQVSHQCINNFLGAYPGLTIEKLVRRPYRDFFAVPRFARINNRLIMSRTGTPKEPLFMGVGNADGTGDDVMVAADVEALAHTYCQRGVPVQFNEYKGDDHTQAAVPFEAGALEFLTQVLAGGSATNGCSSIKPGNSLAPLPVGRTDVELRSVGPAKNGFVVELRTRHGSMSGLALRLRRLEKLVDSAKIKRLSTSWQRITLKVAGKAPARGYYTITVTRAQKIVLYRMQTLG
jgi:hypothetical protein